MEDLREELHSRKVQIKELLLKQEGLCNVLEEPKMKLYEDPLSSAEDIEIFKENLTYLHNLKSEREKTLSDLRASIVKLSTELDLPILEEPCHRFVVYLVLNGFECLKKKESLILRSLLQNSEVTLSNYNIGLLTQLERDLKQQKMDISVAVSNLKKKLDMLWDCLEVDKNVRKKFNAYTGCSQVN